MKNIKLLIIIVFGLQVSLICAAQEFTIDTEQTRQEIIDQAIINFPNLVEGFDSLRVQYCPEIVKFQEYLENNLARNNEESNFGELHCNATDYLLKGIKFFFLQKVDECIVNNIQSFDEIQDPLFVYTMKHKDNIDIRYIIKKGLEECGDKLSLLHTSIQLKNEAIFNLLMTFDIDVNLPTYKPSLLAMACTYGNVEGVRALLKAGAHVNTDEDPLFIAVRASGKGLFHQNNNEYRDEIVSLLLDAGADINKPESSGFHILTVAVAYRNTNVIRIILSTPALNHLNVRDPFIGETVLHMAVKDDNTDIVSMLLDTEIDTLILNNRGRTAYDLIYGDSIQIRFLFAQKRMRQSMNSCCVIS